ncbi:MAG: flagellar protein export ATPase FliI [Nitrospinota bacterium]|nr:MAG: flagellar protein export ATPase FliI [Nitrospinota bacterium]
MNQPLSPRLARYLPLLESIEPMKAQGTVSDVIGLVIEGKGPAASIGEMCDIYPRSTSTPIKAEVVGFKGQHILLMPLGDMHGVHPGSLIINRGERATVKVTPALQGRVLDGLGHPIDGQGPLRGVSEYPLYAQPLNPLRKNRITVPLDVGIRAINGLLTCGKGQRMGIFAGSGVGKSVLLGMIARHTQADVNVIALIGERGREVREFIERDLGQEGLQKSVVVVATSDQSPLIRMRGAYVATAIAEYFRDQGKDVLLLMDSLTRFAMAQREVGLAIGEPPTTKGYTPSVFALLPKLLERAGNAYDRGSITGLYTVLIENDDLNDPIGDAVRAIVDGHIFLSRDLAAKNHYPAIQISHSLSRVMMDIVDPEHQKHAGELREILAIYQEAEDLINIGAYVKGSNPRIDYALRMIEKVQAYLRQGIDEKVTFQQSVEQLHALFA